MKGDRKRKAAGFQPGNEKTIKRMRIDDNGDKEKTDRILKRTSKDKFDFVMDKTDNGLIYNGDMEAVFPMCDGQRTDFTALRPKKTSKSDTIPDEKADNSNSNVIVNRGKMCKMWNDCFKAHKKDYPCCKGELYWDDDHSLQWGMSWKAVLSCTNCNFQSEQFKLYEEVQTGCPGPKPAATTYGIQVGLTKNGVSNGGLTEILASASIKPPAYSTLQRAANHVGKIITEENMEDLERQCAYLRELCEAMGKFPHGPIPAECDATYNNAIYSKVGKSPFQAGTQVDFTVSENLTKDKKIISVVHHSKLCSCPDKDNHLNDCTATLEKDATIGNEGEYLVEAIEKINENGIVIGELTADGDSSAHSKGPTINQPHGVKIKPKYCTWHLKRIGEKKLKGHKFSSRMFKGRNDIERKQAQSRFAYDFSNRIAAEFEEAHDYYGGDVTEINGIMPDVMEAVIDCYRGDCRECDKYSFVCSKENRWSRPFLDVSATTKRDIIVDASRADLEFLREVMQIRLGTEALEKTSNNATSNKSEANNCGIKNVKPRQLTFARNSASRTHSAVHTINNGVGSSIITLCAATGAPIGGVSVYDVLIKLDSEKKYHKNRQRSKKFLLDRRKRRQDNYRLWDQRREEQRPGYIKHEGQDFLENYRPPRNKHMRDHSYVPKSIGN